MKVNKSVHIQILNHNGNLFIFFIAFFISKANSSGSTTVPISQFLSTDMTNKIVVAMILPSMTNDYVLRMYKVAQRAEVCIFMSN